MTKGAYTVLGVGHEASAEEIRKAYRRLALQNHPDKGGTDEDFRRIAEAFNKISTPEERQKYDAALKHNQQKKEISETDIILVGFSYIDHYLSKNNPDKANEKLSKLRGLISDEKILGFAAKYFSPNIMEFLCEKIPCNLEKLKIGGENILDAVLRKAVKITFDGEGRKTVSLDEERMQVAKILMTKGARISAGLDESLGKLDVSEKTRANLIARFQEIQKEQLTEKSPFSKADLEKARLFAEQNPDLLKKLFSDKETPGGKVINPNGNPLDCHIFGKGARNGK